MSAEVRVLRVPADAIVRAADLSPSESVDADVLVIGTGAGGAVVGAVLAEAGKRVVFVEEGKHWTPEQYGAMRPSETMRHLFRDAAMTFAVGIGDTPMIQVLTGRCVGGSSVLTGGVCFRTPEAVLNGWVRHHGLVDYTPARLAPHFEAVEQDIHVEEVPVSLRSKSTEMFARGAEALGVPLKPLRRNTRGCNGCGRCNFGCPHGAKLGVDVTYLPRALAAGARILTECRVSRVLTKGGHAVGVETSHLGPDGKPRRMTLRASKVVVAAGGLASPLLLRRSGLRSPELGKNLTLHPGFRMMGLFDERLDGWKGALQSAYSDAYEHERITLVGLFIPPGAVAATLKGVGPRHTENARMSPYLSVFGGMLHDEAGGRVREVFGRTAITYEMSREDRAAMPVLLRRMAAIYFAAGAKKVVLPLLGVEPVTADEFARLDLAAIPASRFESSSQHPLGTCRMGAQPSRSATNANGKTWEVEDLYVADGSIVPTSLGVNPQLSIMALARRVAHRMLD